MNKVLPDFEKPPVIEVVCGLQFVPIRAFTVPYLGILWDKFKANYPNCREVAPLMPVVERFGEGSREDVFPYTGEGVTFCVCGCSPRIWTRLRSRCKTVASAGRPRREGTRNRSVRGVHEDFESPSNAGIPSAVGFTTASEELSR